MLQALFSSEARIKLLKILLLAGDRRFYLRELAAEAGLSVGNARRELLNLVEAGILMREQQGHQTYYRANELCPIISDLRSMFIKTVGLADVLKAALADLSERIILAFVYGSFARGSETPASDIDVMVVGDVTFRAVVSALRRAQDQLNREINPTVFPTSEFLDKVHREDHFILTVLSEPKVFLIGDENELGRMA